MTRDELISELDNRIGFETDNETYAMSESEKEFYREVCKALEQAPKTGHWTRVTDKTGHLVWECNCGWQQRFHTNYCPDCGAKMESEG